jgi:hypothetical protein
MLAQPALAEADAIIAQNRASLNAWRYDFQGRSAERLRAMCRSAMLQAARAYVGAEERSGRAGQSNQGQTHEPKPADSDATPLIVTGHQPELFHPGVWVKNFASYELARRHDGVSLHLIVDNDSVKKTTVRVPAGTLEDPTVVHLPFDRWRGEIPYEEYEIADKQLFSDFGDRVVSIMEPFGFRPLAATFWQKACTSCGEASRLGECLARARRWQENEWGCRNLELPVSRLCETEGFLWFAAHVLAQISRFRNAYNQALAQYRHQNRIRSRNHPVPSLGHDGDWQESPFWVWSARMPRRRQLFVRQAERTMILTDREGWTQELPLSADREACCAVEVLASLPQRGIKIRTRALTTTIFSRLCLGDLFIHGLGGARYDELTDQIIQQFFGVTPPQFLVITGTLRLPMPPRPGTIEKLHELHRLYRDLTYNPDRFWDGTDGNCVGASEMVERKRQLINLSPTSPSERRHRFEEIRHINGELQPCVSDRKEETTRKLNEMKSDIAANSILRARDWPFIAYPAERLQSLNRMARLDPPTDGHARS